ncbi:MFS transporter [Actinosynnema sp. NPDC047251]|uniref:Permease, MFS-type n=1 Tax=Saccharothrix espanaensis (strain ATCC 51144 / DSM 44229 / JCM 9112 / NBRC 15066 / NRRL 15764) TaxID=1179773 RepID=K0KC82_SACES|nr:MFS transporter [Saccharothrix espanaensis]CCH34213.1 Permease, MFS-type [Saccharothrix espanaensis DSM 44229]
MPVDRATSQAWLIWSTAVVVYVAALFHRTSLGVAGLEAADRFHVGPAALSTFTVLQIGLYALMQIPTGLLVDRFGARRVLVAAALLMGVGQVMFALASSYPLGLGARAVLGIGDAMTWVSVLRLAAAHFPPRRFTVVMSLSAALGGAGNLVATVPLTLLLASTGWTATFLIAGVATAAYSAVVAWRVREVPHGVTQPPVEPVPLRTVAKRVVSAWSVPGTRLGFWVHFASMSTPAMLGLLWGFPYLVEAQGMSRPDASAVLSLLVVVGIVAGPLIGAVIARKPEWRMPIVGCYLGAALVGWAVLLGWPGGVLPPGVLAVVFGVLAVGGPTSGVAFALVRDYNPLHRVSTATGVANVGGFAAITFTAFAVGVVLDLTEGLPVAQAYRIAFLAVVSVLVLGVWRTAVWWRRARAEVFAAEERGEQVPVQLRRRRWDVLAEA